MPCNYLAYKIMDDVNADVVAQLGAEEASRLRAILTVLGQVTGPAGKMTLGGGK